ncbi:cyclophilin-like fold protein [Maribacter sp. PR1]|uniref:Cyclophilin-like fold protein n=1 Tax=Maribacter cobaltidurans TaxID=1178778 RepID=A0ABU7IXC4_9FLAO|nr:MULTISPECIES: cyclophilin-like fold protein [Maribacter]MDC6390245.1 cyclophilin-like fold protein [Maribacter sp. PR1]MEE1977635.1 cyclophilin-like fold protein [Maribacter cobaltidurans]
MKSNLLMVLIFTSFIMGNPSPCEKANAPINTENKDTMINETITITVNSKTFTAILWDNSSAKAFKDMLPMTITMTDLNANEKYYDLPTKLPTKSSNPGTIHNGDLMLYGSNTLVLFYKSFSTSYSYTRLGSIDDTVGLQKVLGAGNVSVTIDKN